MTMASAREHKEVVAYATPQQSQSRAKCIQNISSNLKTIQLTDDDGIYETHVEFDNSPGLHRCHAAT